MDTVEKSSPPEPLEVELEPTFPISLRVVFKALSGLFPYYGPLIINSIRKLIIVKDNPYLGTIGITRRGELIVNKKFWAEHITTDNALRVVLAHELLHSLLGDTDQLPTEEELKNNPDIKLEMMADNIACDSRINAFINAAFPEYNPSEVFGSYYTDEMCEKDFLYKLLKPGSHFIGVKYEEFAQCYSSFYTLNRFKAGNHHELSKLVLEELKKRPQPKKIVIKLLGSHCNSKEEQDELAGKIDENTIIVEINPDSKEITSSEELDEDLKKQIADAVTEELATGQLAGRTDKTLAQKILSSAFETTQKFNLQFFKRFMIDSIFKNVRAQSLVPTDTMTSSPIIPHRISNSDLVRTMADLDVIIWKTKRRSYRFDKMLLPVYLDVSGSTMPYLPQIIKLLANIKEELDYVWGFSEKVVLHTQDDLGNNRINTTGGTDFDCIIEHAIEQKFEHIVVITDGYAYCKYKDRIPQIKSVVTVLFGGDHRDNYFSKNYGSTHSLDEVTL